MCLVVKKVLGSNMSMAPDISADVAYIQKWLITLSEKAFIFKEYFYAI